MKRPAVALIEELRSEAEGAVVAGMIVRFETSTLFLTLQDADPAASLDAMAQNGGTPVGLYRVTRSTAHPKGLDFSVRPLQEVADEPGIGDFFLTIAELILEMVLKEISGRNQGTS